MEVRTLKFLFTNVTPAWVLLPLFAALCVYTVNIYKRHSLPRPWNRILPGIRIVAIAMLILALFQPVIARFSSVTVRSRIPVLVDTSGSMSLTDKYSPAEAVRIAGTMKLFPPALRCTVFDDRNNEWNLMDQFAAAARITGSVLKEHVNANRMLEKEQLDQIYTLSDSTAAAGKRLEELRRDMEKAVKDTAYLAGPGPGQTGERFKEKHNASLSAMQRLGDGFKNTSKSLKDAAKASDGGRNAASETISKLFEYTDKIDEVDAMLHECQALADERLAATGNTDVEKGLQKLALMSRADLAQALLSGEPFNLVNKLQDLGEVNVFSFQEKTEIVEQENYTNLCGSLPTTKIGSALQAVLKYHEKDPVSAIVLISDGNNNSGKPLEMMREILREREIPVFSIGIGSAEPPPDIAIAQVLAPRSSFVDDKIKASVVLTRRGFLDKKIRVRITDDGKEIASAFVEPGNDEKVIIDMPFSESRSGLHSYNVEAEELENEAFHHNNEKTFVLNVLKDRIRTLVIDEFPRWETRYINMMLKRDKRVDLKTIFIASTKDGRLPDGADGYPATRDELFGYHVLVIGDVNPRHFSREQLEDLRDFVTKRGGTLLAMAGEHYMPSRYQGTALAELLPLSRFIGSDSSGRYSEKKPVKENLNLLTEGIFQMDVEEFARYEDIIQIGATPEESEELWENLPGLNWIQEGVSASRSADLLVSASLDGQKNKASPVMIKAYVGLGKVLYLGSDSFWRWRYRARWTYHHRFWGQVLMWATMGRTAGNDPNIKLMSDRAVYAPEEIIVIKARLLDDKEIPISNADAAVEIYTDEATDKEKNSLPETVILEQPAEKPGKLVKVVPFIHIENSGGEYRAQIRDLPRGSYRVVPKIQELSSKKTTVEVKFTVRDISTSEYVDMALNDVLLKEVSDKYVPFDRALSLLKSIPKVETTNETRSDTELWDTFYWMLIVAVLLGFEWATRKSLKLM